MVCGSSACLPNLSSTCSYWYNLHVLISQNPKSTTFRILLPPYHSSFVSPLYAFLFLHLKTLFLHFQCQSLNLFDCSMLDWRIWLCFNSKSAFFSQESCRRLEFCLKCPTYWYWCLRFMNPILSEIFFSGCMINSTIRRRTHLVQSFSVAFLYWLYYVSWFQTPLPVPDY